MRLLVLLLVSLILISITVTAFAYGGQLIGTRPYAPNQSWIGLGVSVILFVGSQIIFILPLVKPPKITSKGKPLLRSLLVAGLFAAILTIGFGMLVMSIVQLSISLPLGDQWAIPPRLFVGGWAVTWSELFELSQPEVYTLYIEFGVLVVFWIFWTTLLWVYVQRRNRDPGLLVRITGWLFAGTLFEVLLAVPLMLIVRRRSDCYCSTGSFGVLILSIMGCLWLCGPGFIIAMFWRKRPWTKDHCANCGYPKKITNAEVCSECGKRLIWR